MSLGLHETRVRRQRRIRWTIAKWVITLGAILAAGIFAYRTGTSLAEREVISLNREIETLSDKAAELQSQNTELRANEILLEERLRVDRPETQPPPFRWPFIAAGSTVRRATAAKC